MDERGLPVPYAAVGLSGKSFGTLSDANGAFSLNLKWFSEKDTLKATGIGYESKKVSLTEFIASGTYTIVLIATPGELAEVEILSKELKQEELGCKRFHTNNCSGFVRNASNWKGSEAGMFFQNKKNKQVFLESFSFYVIQNKYEDSLSFRLMVYQPTDFGLPKYKSLLDRPVFFKIGKKNGEVIIDLKAYHIRVSGDFFISIECLMDEMDISKFCYAGSPETPSFVKPAPFEKWSKVRGGGPDFKLRVLSSKD